MIIEGWRIDRLVIAVGAGLGCSVLAVAIVTAASHNLDAGLSAGSYTVAAATLLIATLTLVSAIT